MPFATETSEFWGWYLRHNSRTIWKNLADAGIDVFASGPSNNPQAFLDLTNILPAMNSGFLRRWGTSVYQGLTSVTVPTPVRTFIYSVAQDQSNVAQTVNTNLWLTTDNQHFNTFNDSGIPASGFTPTDFASVGSVYGITSRQWFYYGNGVNAPRKIQLNNTGLNTDSLLGIAIPSSAPGSSIYTSYPCAIIPTLSDPSAVTGAISLTNAASGYSTAQNIIITGGSGSGMLITIDSVYSIPGGANGIINTYHVTNWGSGYAIGDTVNDSAGAATWYVQAVPAVVGTGGPGSGGTGLGYTPSSNFVVSCLDTGSGTGGQITCFTDSNGAVVKALVTAPGSGYSQAYVLMPSPGTGGVQGWVTLYTQINPSAPNYGEIVGADLAGPMSFVQGRQWTVALQNSYSGHTSDVYVTQLPFGPTTAKTFDALTSAYTELPITGTTTDVPVYVSSQNQTAGFTQIDLTISIPYSAVDLQVDTVVLLATADGQSLGTLYQVAIFPLSTFTLANGFFTRQYYDSLPDSFNNTTNYYGVGNTLLAADLWAYTDPSGNTFGILLNTPPTPEGFLYPTQHQGRMFATDGKTVFFSKSLDEVTTSTGLITSKWEECWPGDYQLPVALNNETILGLVSDGTNLHIGTDKSIFTLYGSDPSSFSIPSQAFAQTGILSNDCWTVIYAEGIPSGFVWITQDHKVIHSDFSTYREIGTSIYPVLNTIDPSKIANNKILSLTQGPYNFVVLQLFLTGSSNPQPEFWIWESRLQKWYHWVFSPASISTVGSSFVYQVPAFTTSALVPGTKFLFFWNYNSSALTTFFSNYFNPVATEDTGLGSGGVIATPISWSVRTSWQDLGDSTSIKCANEIEFTSDESVPLTVTLYGATSQTQFDSGGVVLRTGNSMTGPMSALGVNKFYTAGVPTSAKYYSVGFKPIVVGQSPSVLTSFSIETYPMARI